VAQEIAASYGGVLQKCAELVIGLMARPMPLRPDIRIGPEPEQWALSSVQ
jgi:hypothetical protein